MGFTPEIKTPAFRGLI